MTITLLVRHGYMEGIKPELFRGSRADLALTETGQRQAGLLAMSEAPAQRQAYASIRLPQAWQPNRG
jgi:broad specificity phosphatase PhoE